MRQRIQPIAALAVGLVLVFMVGIARAQRSAPVISGYGLTDGRTIYGGPPGTQLVIHGSDFHRPGNIRFNDLPLTFNAWAPTYIRIVVPKMDSYPTEGRFIITTVRGDTAYGPRFTITASGYITDPPPPPPAPTITEYTDEAGSPTTSGLPGTRLVIHGANFDVTGTVAFNGQPVSHSSWSSTSVRVTVPTAGSYPASGSFTLTTVDRLTVTGPSFTITDPSPEPDPAPAPSVTGYADSTGAPVSSGPPGAAVMIQGANLGTSGTVTFNGAAVASSSWTETAIHVSVPTASSYPSQGAFVVTRTDGQSATGPAFTITAPPPPPPPAPTITGYTDTSGAATSSAPPGTTVVIQGASLGSAGSVTFNGAAVTHSSWTASAIQVTVPTAGSYPSQGAFTVNPDHGQTATGPSFTITAPPASPPLEQTPYPGTPFAVPGTIQAEDFDLGGEGIAYHDAVAGNAGGLYRPNEDVDIISYPGVGHVVNNIQTGEWLEYTIQVGQSGSYRLEASVSSEFTTSRWHLEVDGVNVTGSILTPNTGSWSTFQWVGVGDVSLSAGQHVLRFFAEQEYANLDALRITAEAAPPPAPAISGYTDTSGAAVSSAPPGTPVVIQGANFGTAAGTVTFNGTSVTFSSWTETATQVTVPTASSYPSAGQFTVTRSDGEAVTGPSFTITAPPPPPPSVSGYTDTSGAAISSAPPGTPIVIQGTNLGTAGSVTFNGSPVSHSSWTATAIQVSVPTAGSYPSQGSFQVTRADGQVATGPVFTITAPSQPSAPAITGYTDSTGATSSAPPGAQIVIQGSSLGSAGSVTFNGSTVTFSSWTETAIQVTVPTADSYPSEGAFAVTTADSRTATGPPFTITQPPSGGGSTITVSAGGSFQSALDSAQPGDTIVVEAGATFVGPFTLPNKSGASWITIQSSALSQLPVSGQRVGPGNAAAMPKIVSPGNGESAIVTARGAHHYRLVGLEITRAASAGEVYGLVTLGSDMETDLSQMPHDLVIDRCYIHGQPTAEVRRGVALNCGDTTITGCYISDIKSTGYDTQAVAGWNGPGPFRILNNYLEAAGENIMFGGGDPAVAGLVPSDIEIRRNHITKPLSWRGQWIVKNLLELKNARRVTIDGNLFENNWGGDQGGHAVLFVATNQDGTAPSSTVGDVEFTNNHIRRCGGGINIGINPPVVKPHRIRIANNLFTEIDGQYWVGDGRFLLVADVTDLVVEHNTAFHNGATLMATGSTDMTGFIFRNNITQKGDYGISGDGVGEGNVALSTYFPGAIVQRNVIQGVIAANYPPDNFYPATLEEIRFVDLAGGNYRLRSDSPYQGQATDGTDPGCNVAALDAAMR
jgi:hypothetical protein